jgi:hypothetical protein
MTPLLALALLLAPQELTARATCAPEEAEIGQPIECALEVRHPAGVRVRVKAGELELDDSWVLLEEPTVATLPAEGGGERTRAVWRVASLEPGARTLELPTPRYEWDGALHALSAEPARVTVRPALAEGEDAPRPARGFRPPPPEPAPPVPRTWLAALLGVVATLVVVMVVARLRRRPQLAPAPATPGEELARLMERPLDEPADVRGVHYELSRLVRRAVDERLGRDLRGLTDAEWLERTAATPGVSKETHDELARLFATCERVKYGQEVPTRWAAKETLESARALVEHGAAPRPAPRLEEVTT